MYTNADDLMNKRSELQTSIEVNQPDIIAITEVPLKYKGNRIQIAELESGTTASLMGMMAEVYVYGQRKGSKQS